MVRGRLVLLLVLCARAAVVSAAPDLVINEVMTNPDPNRANPYGFDDNNAVPTRVVSDWVEIYNRGATAVNFATTAVFLSKNCSFPSQRRLPQKDATGSDLILAPDTFLVLWCPGNYLGIFNCSPDADRGGYKPCPVPIPGYMAPFTFAPEGDWIGLYVNEGTEQDPVYALLDGFDIPQTPPDQSYGCFPDGDTSGRGFLREPTIGVPAGPPPPEPDDPPANHWMSGAPNTGQINLAPVIEVLSYRAVRGEGECKELSLRVAPGDPVLVRVRVRDPEDPDPHDQDDNLREVVLFWHVTSSQEEPRQILMEPDPHDSSNHSYRATIPGQSDGTVVAFSIAAESETGKIAETPDRFAYPVGQVGASTATLVINEVLATNARCPDYDEGEVQDPATPRCQKGGVDRGKDNDRKQTDDTLELYNTGAQPLPLNDLYLTSCELYPTRLRLIDAVGHHLKLDRQAQLPAGETMLIWCDDEVFQNDEVGFHAPFKLDEHEDEVLLVAYRDEDEDGDPETFLILDLIAWGPDEEYGGDEVAHHLGPQDPDWSLGRYPDGGEAWGHMAPSPGLTVDPGTGMLHAAGGTNTDFIPYVKLVSFEPESPQVGQPITFEYRVWDDDPLPPGGVVLSYANAEDVTDKTIVMGDDGTGADEGAGDEIYTAVIDDAELSGKVRYSATAEDADANSLRVPASSPNSYGNVYVGVMPSNRLVLSEVVAANRDCGCGAVVDPGCELAGLDNFREAEGWVEICNPTEEAIEIQDYFLTDRLDWLSRYRLPRDVELGPGACMIVWCDAQFAQDDDGAYHAPFLLDAGGGEVALVYNRDPFKVELQIVDIFRFGPQVPDMSFGRDPVTGEVGMLMQPTLPEPGVPASGENARLAANAQWITELGDPTDPQELEAGSVVTVTGLALDMSQKVFIVDPLGPVCDARGVLAWDFEGLETPPVELTAGSAWSLQGEDLRVTLPNTLSGGSHLLCVLSGFSETWWRGGVPWTRIEFAIACNDPFLRGDANADGDVNVADAVCILQYLFAGGSPIACPDAVDANDDERLNLADAVYILQYLFANGPAIPPPTGTCGLDPTASPAGGPDLPPCQYPGLRCPPGEA
jgi:hypothetical protein